MLGSAGVRNSHLKFIVLGPQVYRESLLYRPICFVLQITDADFSGHQNSESITEDALVLNNTETTHEDITATVENIYSTNDEAEIESVDLVVPSESQVEIAVTSVNTSELEDTDKMDEDNKCNEIELINPDEDMSRSSDNTADVHTNVVATESSLPEEDQISTAILVTPLPDTNSVAEATGNPTNNEAEVTDNPTSCLSTLSDTTNDPMPDNYKLPQSVDKNVETIESNSELSSRTTRSSSSAANRLRRSVRIRKTSSDKDTVVKKKK